MDAEIKERIERIIFVSLFLFISTLIWQDSRNRNNESMAIYNNMVSSTEEQTEVLNLSSEENR
ncbi:MAG TPA: hypothetical protein PLT65_04875 [Bacilli bacterium]|nr:hypothetical protein [Bacilli bacterium]